MIYFERINKTFAPVSTLVKKNFKRGSQFVEEMCPDVSSIYIQQSEDLYVVKGLCAASLKKVDRWVVFCLKKNPCEIYFGYCQCPAGTAGTCSHGFALMKMVTKWIAEGQTNVPESVPCTSKLQVWSIPQSRGRVHKISVPEIRITSPVNKEATTSVKKKTTKKGYPVNIVRDTYQQ